jgi:hypothetical protein
VKQRTFIQLAAAVACCYTVWAVVASPFRIAVPLTYEAYDVICHIPAVKDLSTAEAVGHLALQLGGN